jgi:hypothetical protein
VKCVDDSRLPEQAGHGERHDVHAPVTGFHHRVFSNNGFVAVACGVVQLIATDYSLMRRKRVFQSLNNFGQLKDTAILFL